MLSLYKFLAAAIFLTTTAVATPIANPAAADATTAVAACQPITTFNAKFDNLGGGSGPPNGFAGANWNGWTVVSGVPLNPKSGANLLQAGNAETSSISVSSSVIMQIQSFYFGCTAEYPGLDEVYAEACSIMVTTLPYTNNFQVATAGPFTSTYEPGYEGFPQGNLTRVDLEVASSEFYFQVVSSLAEPTLYLDNVVIISQNNC